MPRLSVNVNKVATLRNTRRLGVPSVVRLARVALEAGAQGITVHPRPDQRHIRPADVDELAELFQDFPRAEYTLEGNPFDGLLEHCLRVRPAQALLVPDERTASTSDKGWALLRLDGATQRALTLAIRALHDAGIRVSLFVEPAPELMIAARDLGAERVELYTEPYARVASTDQAASSLERYALAVRAAREAELGVNAGHDLSLGNLAAFLAGVGRIDEVSIGHALISDALELGMAEATRRYLALCAS